MPLLFKSPARIILLCYDVARREGVIVFQIIYLNVIRGQKDLRKTHLITICLIQIRLFAIRIEVNRN